MPRPPWPAPPRDTRATGLGEVDLDRLEPRPHRAPGLGDLAGLPETRTKGSPPAASRFSSSISSSTWRRRWATSPELSISRWAARAAPRRPLGPTGGRGCDSVPPPARRPAPASSQGASTVTTKLNPGASPASTSSVASRTDHPASRADLPNRFLTSGWIAASRVGARRRVAEDAGGDPGVVHGAALVEISGPKRPRTAAAPSPPGW